jgi:putative copper export protein
VASLLRGLALGTLMGAAGLLFFLSWAGGGAEVTTRGAALARVLSVVAVVLLAVHLCAWVVNASPEHQLDRETIASALMTRVGRVELWRGALALLAAWAIVLTRRPRLALPFAFAALVVGGATGHSAAIEPVWNTPAKALHLVAVAIWLGGLLRLLTFERGDVERFVREAGRVSSAALGAVLVVTLSGVVQTWFLLTTPLDLVRSTYGIVLVAKIAGLLVLVAFGAHHRQRVLPGLALDVSMPDHFALTLRREVIVMTVVILLGGLLGYLPPPRDARSGISSSVPTLQ